MASPRGEPVDARRLAVPAASFVGALVVLLAAYGWLLGQFDEIKATMDDRLDAIELSLDRIDRAATHDRWTGRDQLVWSQRLREANPALKVPIPIQQGRDE